MAYKRKNDAMVQTVFSNTVEVKFNPVKQYYGIVLVDGKEKLYRYESKFRSEATAALEEEARLDHGKLLSVGVLKN